MMKRISSLGCASQVTLPAHFFRLVHKDLKDAAAW